MNKQTAAIGSSVFFAIAPGTFAGVVPWLITRWEMQDVLPQALLLPARIVGVALVLAGLPVLIHAFYRFVVEGIGTPSPNAPPEHLVVGGLFRYVRNPMYVALFSIIIGQYLLFQQTGLLIYIGCTLIVVGAWVRIYEEPSLRRRFGADYATYCANVPRWWPRLHGWTP